VEQFIEDFNGVLNVTQWPLRVALVKLRKALTEQARLFGQGRSIAEIFTALRNRFGTFAQEARTNLQVLLQKENTQLRDHATLVKRLARSAYSDLPETHRQIYTLTDFIQSFNDAGLHHQLQAKRVTSLEGALHDGEDYFWAKCLYTEETKCTRFTAETVQSLGDEMGRLSAMLKRVAKTLTIVNPYPLPEDQKERP